MAIMAGTGDRSTSSSGNAITDFFGGLFDTARGVFREITDFELARSELELAREERQQENADLRTQFPADNQLSDGGGAVAGFNATTLLLLGAAAVGVFLLLRN